VRADWEKGTATLELRDIKGVVVREQEIRLADLSKK